MRFSVILALIVFARFVLSCGPAPGQQQPGVAASPDLSQELNQRINQGEDESHDLTFQLDDLRTQIQQAQANLQALQASAQNEITNRTDAYAARDVQVQNQQLELDIVRSQLDSQIQAQKGRIAALQSMVAQQQAWGFESPDLEASSAELAQEQDRLAALESQYWQTEQQRGQINALASEARTWGENEDRTSVEQGIQSQIQAQSKEIDQLTAQYNELSNEQSEIRNSVGELQEQYKEASLH